MAVLNFMAAAAGRTDAPAARGLHPAGAPWRIDPVDAPADPALIACVGAGQCLRLGLLPWRRVGGATIVLAPDAAHLETHAARLAPLGPLRHVPASPEVIRAGLRKAAGGLLVAEAENRVAEIDSCRSLTLGGPWAALAVAALVLPLLVFLPLLLLGAVLCWAALGLALTTGLRLAALFASRPQRIALPGPGDPQPARLPLISLLVPLFKEREIAGHLLRRLDALDYPRDRLDLCLIVEAEDDLTRANSGCRRSARSCPDRHRAGRHHPDQAAGDELCPGLYPWIDHRHL